MLPDGLRYVDSWVVADDALDRCFQLMETDDPSLFDVWLDNWRDLGSFEVYPVITSAEASERVAVKWSGGPGPQHPTRRASNLNTGRMPAAGGVPRVRD